MLCNAFAYTLLGLTLLLLSDYYTAHFDSVAIPSNMYNIFTTNTFPHIRTHAFHRKIVSTIHYVPMCTSLWSGNDIILSFLLVGNILYL